MARRADAFDGSPRGNGPRSYVGEVDAPAQSTHVGTRGNEVKSPLAARRADLPSTHGLTDRCMP